MAGAARVTDATAGAYNEEHGGHYTGEFNDEPVHNGGSLTGVISSGSGNVFTNGLSAARVSDTVAESDECTDGTGVIVQGSGSVFINGLSASRIGDSIAPHCSGYDVIVGGSGNVFIGG